jgi:predicted phosphodiesterase
MAASAERKAAYGRKRTERARKRREVLGRLERLLVDEDIELDEVGSIEKVRVNEWQVVTKNDQGKPEVTTARAASLVINPLWETGPKWPVVQPAAPVKVTVPKRAPALLKGYKTAVVEPDPQFGFIREATGTLHPIHDPRAVDIAEQITEAERPHNWVNVGDYLDLAECSTFRQEPGFAGTMQPAIEEGYRHAAVCRAMASEDCWIHEGNHDQRLMNYFLDNARAAFGIKRAGSVPKDWPVVSLPFLLRLDELDIEYVDGYPATWRYINERLATTHGTNMGPDALRKIVEQEQVSVIAGHTHHAGTVYKTRNTRTRFVQTLAHSAGTLARIDGFVPGGGKYRGRKVDGMPTRSWQDWQQGVTVVRYVPGDGPFEIEHVVINEGTAIHRGQMFESRVTL